jgi:Protein of unknown function (DUF3606).
MSDDKTNRGEPDRSRVSGEERYEVEYFAERHKITPDQARELIAKHGSDRAKLDEAAAHLRSS